MKIFSCALLITVLFSFTDATPEAATDPIYREDFREQNEDIQATFNIANAQDKENVNSMHILGNEEQINVLIKTKNSRGSSMAHSMSLNVGMEIKRAGILGTTISKKDFQYLEQHPDIESIEIDQTLYALEDPVFYLRKLSETTPYGIPMVLQDADFWNSLDEPNGTIKVCVADTGYDLGHVDLPRGDDVIGTSNPSYPGEVWYEDGHGHGSHCSGTVAALGGNDKGVVGVIPDNSGRKFQLVIGNALTGSGSGTGSGVLKAIDTCVENGAKVVSLSLGGGSYSQITANYYKNLYEDDGILFIAAAGNGGSSSKLYPASYPALVSVAALDSNKNTASFSQYNDQLEISGPGVAVTSTFPNDGYKTWSGTSMATPHVAGVAGLLWMYFPECKNYEIRNVLAATAEDLKENGCDFNTGYGLVQAKNAYDLLSLGGCGGNIGQISPKGGCEQLVPVGPTNNPTPAPPTAVPSGPCGCLPADGKNQAECYGRTFSKCKQMIDWEGKCKWTDCIQPSHAPTPPPTPSTYAPVPPPTSPTPVAPTLFPTQTQPTMFPTHSTPTMYPTAAADPVPTPYPTDVPPTPLPTQNCASKGEPCEKNKDCCKQNCNKKKGLCKK